MGWKPAQDGVVCCGRKSLSGMAFQLVVDNPDFLFLVPSQRLKRLNHHPQWRAGNFGENYDAQVKIPRSPKPGKTAEYRCSRRAEAEGEEMSDGDASLRG